MASSNPICQTTFASQNAEVPNFVKHSWVPMFNKDSVEQLFDAQLREMAIVMLNLLHLPWDGKYYKFSPMDNQDSNCWLPIGKSQLALEVKIR